MYDLPANSFDLYKANPLFSPVDFSAVPFKKLAAEIKSYEKKNNPYPETDALRFYLYNHAFHLLQNKFGKMSELPPDLTTFAQTHINATSLIAKRMLCHTIVSTICEMDYLSTQKPEYYQQLTDSYGEGVADFFKVIHKTNNWRGFDKVDATCGELTGGLVSGFAFSNWPYRKPWTRITGLSRQCVFGEISLESYTDQSFSLTHWGGSVLNKCHLYQCCTNEFYHLLDVQDSGQIPQWVGSNMSSQYVTKELKDMYAILKRHFPDEMNGPVNKSLVSNSQKKREAVHNQIKQAVQAAFNQGGTGGRTPPEVDNRIVRTNKTLMGL